jgi:RNA polymerase sigma-70 factor (ECF subfamily)
MSPDDDRFRDLIRRVRAGDGEAATELVRRFEPSIRRAVHARLTDPQLRRLFDSQDICQSVFKRFFVCAASGRYELDRPEQLLRLLAVMARNKLRKQVEKQQAQKHGGGRPAPAPPDAERLVDPGPSPSEAASHSELLQEILSRLSAEERLLAEWRRHGLSWEEIATEVGGSPDALRMRYNRAIDRVTGELGLDV